MFNLVRMKGLRKFNLNVVRFNFGSSHGHDTHAHNHDSHAHHNSHDSHGHDSHGHDDHGHHEITGEVDLDKVYVPLNSQVKLINLAR
jgi:hypothetical protein